VGAQQYFMGMVALVIIFVFWVVHSIPDRTDLRWLARRVGFSGANIAKKFNGQS
jgi:formate dehydrogenase subunit gamma